MPDQRNLLLQYAGFATQLAVALLASVYAGKWVDARLSLGIPLLIWLLPLCVLIALLVKVVRDTSKKPDE
jgi:hypothetical protein